MTRTAGFFLIATLLLLGCPEESYNVANGNGDDDTREEGDVRGTEDGAGDLQAVDNGPPFNNTLGWKVLNTGQSETWNTIWGVNLEGGDYQVFVGGALGTVMYYASADDRWHQINLATSLNVNSVWATDATYIVIAGEGGLLKRYFKFADKPDWYHDDMTTGVFQDLNSVSGCSKDAIWAVGAHGTILRFDGNEWTKVDAAQVGLGNDPPDLFAVKVLTPEHVIFGGKGKLVHYENGEWFVDHSNFALNEVRGIYAEGDQLWIAAGKGTLYRRKEGHFYEKHQPNVYSLFDSIWISQSGLVYAGASSPPPIVWTYDGNDKDNWEDLAVEPPGFIKEKNPGRIIPNTRVSGIWGTGDENIFVCTKEKQVIRYAVHE